MTAARAGPRTAPRSGSATERGFAVVKGIRGNAVQALDNCVRGRDRGAGEHETLCATRNRGTSGDNPASDLCPDPTKPLVGSSCNQVL